jgi:hypothetical protein
MQALTFFAAQFDDESIVGHVAPLPDIRDTPRTSVRGAMLISSGTSH